MRPMRRAKEKETGGNGKHECKGAFGGNGQHRSKEAPQSTRKVQDEEEEVRGEDECREAKFQLDLRQMEEKRRAQEQKYEEKENYENEEEEKHEEEDERVRMASIMGACGSHPQATSDPEREREEQWKVKCAEENERERMGEGHFCSSHFHSNSPCLLTQG